MGLDMYFSKRTYVQNWEHNPEEKRYEIVVKQNGKVVDHIDTSKITYIIEEFGYWRKFNALHDWFVENVQDGVDNCQEYYITEAKLIELLETLKKVQADHSLAEELLPTTEGFFFGGVDYDEYYFKDVENAIEVIEKAVKLSTTEPYPEFYYRSSW